MPKEIGSNFSIKKCVDQIMELKKEGKDTSDLEAQIDQMVYDLYELTEEEREIVDSSF
jgi:hypothetical protein